MTEETKNPGHDVPLGLILSMLVITLVYCAMPPGHSHKDSGTIGSWNGSWNEDRGTWNPP
jgi:hypothetical protein